MESPVRGRVVAFLMGGAGALLGLLPWVAAGPRLPLQNLWVRNTTAEAFPFASLPVSQYYAREVVALLVVGAALGALLVRVAPGSRALADDRGAVWSGAAGVLAVDVAAAAQTFAVLAWGLGLTDGKAARAASVYFGGMLAGVLIAVVIAVVAFRLLAVGGPVGVVVGIALVAPLLPAWIRMPAVMHAGSLPGAVGAVVAWLPAVVVGVALGILGLDGRGRAGGWLGSLFLLWFSPAFFGVVFAALSSRILRDDIAARVEAASESIPRMALAPLGQVAVAAAIGLLIVAVQRGHAALGE